MKVTRSQLIQIIQEELGQIDEIEIFGRTFGKKARRKKAAEKRRKEKERADRKEEDRLSLLDMLEKKVWKWVGKIRSNANYRSMNDFADYHNPTTKAWRAIRSALIHYFDEKGVDICPEMNVDTDFYVDRVTTAQAVYPFFRCIRNSDVDNYDIIADAFDVFDEASKTWEKKRDEWLEKQPPKPTFDREAHARSMAKLRPRKQGQEWGEVEGDYEYSMEERIMQKVKNLMEKK